MYFGWLHSPTLCLKTAIVEYESCAVSQVTLCNSAFKFHIIIELKFINGAEQFPHKIMYVDSERCPHKLKNITTLRQYSPQ